MRDGYLDPEEPDDPGYGNWGAYANLFLGGFSDVDHSVLENLKVSVFRVRRSERAEGDLEEVWLGR